MHHKIRIIKEKSAELDEWHQKVSDLMGDCITSCHLSSQTPGGELPRPSRSPLKSTSASFVEPSLPSKCDDVNPECAALVEETCSVCASIRYTLGLASSLLDP